MNTIGFKANKIRKDEFSNTNDSLTQNRDRVIRKAMVLCLEYLEDNYPLLDENEKDRLHLDRLKRLKKYF